MRVLSNLMSPAAPRFPLLSFTEIAKSDFGDADQDTVTTYRMLLDWTRSFLMSAHPDLGRTGDVCPFTAQGARMDTLRYGVSLASGRDVPLMRRQMLDAFEAFGAMPHPKRMGHFRAVIVGFPNCRDADGLEGLSAVQRTLRLKSLWHDRMVGFFHDSNEAEGLWSSTFRPLRSPIPLLAIRALVENDAAFAVRNPLLVPTYLKRYKVPGGRRLVAQWLRRA